MTKPVAKSANKKRSINKKVKVLALDRDKLQAFFETCASAAAANLVATVETTGYSGVHVKVDLKKYRRIRAQCLAASWNAFFRFADRGPRVLINFLRQKQKDLARDIAAKKGKFKRANQVTEEFVNEYNRVITGCHQLKCSGLLAMIVFPVALGLPVGAALGVGLGYGFSCTFAQTFSEAACAGIVMLVDSPKRSVKRITGTGMAAATKAAVLQKAGTANLERQAARPTSEVVKRHLPKLALSSGKKRLAAKAAAALGKSVAAGAGAIISILCLSEDLMDAIGNDYAERRDQKRKTSANRNRAAVPQ